MKIFFSSSLMISLIDNKLGKGMMEFEKGRLIGYQGEGIRLSHQFSKGRDKDMQFLFRSTADPYPLFVV